MIFEPQLLCSHVSAVLSKHILMLFVTRNFEIYFVQNNNKQLIQTFKVQVDIYLHYAFRWYYIALMSNIDI